MSYFNNEDDLVEKISLDELYDRKNEVNQNRILVYKKILQRVFNRIKITSRQKIDEQFCYFVVPEHILGLPKYDVDTCTSFIIDKLQDNGFQVKYTHPNLLFISWRHYIPAYERQRIKEETGKKIDGFGNIIGEKDEKEEAQNLLTNPILTLTNKKDTSSKSSGEKKEYKDIEKFKSSELYNLNLFSNLKKLE